MVLKSDVQVVSGGRRVPAGAKNVQRFAVDVIVHKSGIHAECTHQQNDVSAAEKHVPNL